VVPLGVNVLGHVVFQMDTGEHVLYLYLMDQKESIEISLFVAIAEPQVTSVPLAAYQTTETATAPR
jgi:hypothetical protein